ncbi:hypothetical protein LEP3755_34530 [Leptolyngbya sp. NIES-3755]|nr:hypothetical protein LEP3755_34530 [Leptolyngbya sp. NIES-3755]
MSEEPQESWRDRVERLESNLAQFIDFVAQNQRTQAVQLQTHQEQITEIRQISQQLAQAQIETFTRIDRMQAEIQEMQNEIRGLRIETQRMLDAYLNPDSDEDNQN